jgi:sporulation protein YlmC with PRC-barrel domain
MKISEIYRMDIYSDSGAYLGEVQDVIVDLEKGEVSRLLMVPWKNAKGDAKSVLRQRSVLYKNVKNVGDVVLVSAPAGGQPSAANEGSREEVDDLSR